MKRTSHSADRSGQAPVRAVIFDIDGTLTSMMSWTDLTAALGASVDRHKAIFRDYLDGRISYEESRVELLGLWQATGRADRSTMRQIFADWPLSPAAKPLITQLHGQNIRVCLITGSFDLYADTVAQRLHVRHWYANTKLIFDETDHLASYDYVRDQAGEKLKQFQDFLAATGILATECLTIGDGPNDLELFRATGRGILIDPNPNRPELAELRQAAWHSVHQLSDTHAIIETTF